MAFALKGAASAGVLPCKWGGVFGQEFTGLLAPGVSDPTAVSPGSLAATSSGEKSSSANAAGANPPSSIAEMVMMALTRKTVGPGDVNRELQRPVAVLMGFLIQ